MDGKRPVVSSVHGMVAAALTRIVFSEHLGGQPERREWGLKITTPTINFP